MLPLFISSPQQAVFSYCSFFLMYIMQENVVCIILLEQHVAWPECEPFYIYLSPAPALAPLPPPPPPIHLPFPLSPAEENLPQG